jgi:hypothetical protein
MSNLPDFKKLVDAVFGRKDPKTPPLVEVLWLDASDIDSGWFGHEEITRSKPAPSLSVGYLFHKDDVCVKIVSLVNDTHGGNGIMIPTGMVKKINYLHR